MHRIGSVSPMAGQISMGARREVVLAVAERYRLAGRTEKGRIGEVMSDTAAAPEKRVNARTMVRRAGWTARTKGEQLRECVVWDESPSGARLIVDNPQEFPEAFYIYLTLDFSSRRHCRGVWRSDRELGVHYVDGHPR